MRIMSTGKVIAIKSGGKHTFELEMQSLDKKHITYSYTNLYTMPYIITDDGKLALVNVGDILPYGMEIISGYGYCPECGEPFFGSKSHDGQIEYECTNKKCSFKFPKEIKGHIINKKDVIELMTTRETKVISGFTQNGSSGFKGQLCLDDENLIQFKRI